MRKSLSRVGDADAGLQIFKLNDFLLQAAQLFLTVGEIIGSPVEWVVVTGAATSAIPFGFLRAP